MPVNNQDIPADFKIVKPSFIKFIKLVREIRLNSLGKSGSIIIPKSEMDKIADLKLNYFIRQLIRDGVLELLEDDKKDYKLKSGNITVNCNPAEKIDEYLEGLYVPRSSGLIIKNNGGYITRYGLPDKFHVFSEQDATVLDFLHRNAGHLQTNEAIAQGCREKLNKNLTPDQLRSIIYNLRRRIKEKLGYDDKEMKEILPKYNHGGYVLKV